MKRLVLLLMLGSVAMFVFVLRTPGRLFPSTIFWQDESKQTGEKADAKFTKSQVTNVATAANSSRSRAPRTSRRTAPDTPAKTEIQAPAIPHARIRPSQSDVISSKTLTISGNSALLYANNSSKSNVLTVLGKGTVVEPNLQVLDAADNWTLVRVPTLNVFGFVQTSNLARTSQETIP